MAQEIAVRPAVQARRPDLLNLEPQNAKLWLRRKEFVSVDQEVVRRALAPVA